jgi:hypothetical protein
VLQPGRPDLAVWKQREAMGLRYLKDAFQVCCVVPRVKDVGTGHYEVWWRWWSF